jgi:hypothetical protein
MEATQTYVAGATALFLAHVSTATAVLGLVLVIVRLAYEIPKAWRVWRTPKDE